MVGEGELAQLTRRKESLIRENDAARAKLADDFSSAQSVGEWLDSGIGRARQIRPFLIVLAPLAGYALVRRRKGFSELFLAAKAALRFARRFQKAAEFLRRI